MIQNRSVPPCPVIPVLYYPDPGVAAEWLRKAFGFRVRMRIANHRIQMKAEGGCFVVAECKQPLPDQAVMAGVQSVLVRVEDAAAHCEHARQNGATILAEPVDHFYGERQYSAADFAGHRWSFTQSIADKEPEEWGGTSVEL